MAPHRDTDHPEALRTFHARYDALKALVGDGATADALLLHRDAFGSDDVAAILKDRPSFFGRAVSSPARAQVVAQVEAAHAAHVALDRIAAQGPANRLQLLGRPFDVDERAGIIRFADGSREVAPLVRCEPERPPARRRTAARQRDRER